MNEIILTMTNNELDEAIVEARGEAIRAWSAQCRTTVEDGYSHDRAEAALRRAEEAQAYYEALYNEREARDMLRHELAAVLRENGAAVIWWIQNGPWTYGFRGEQRIARAQRLVEFCRNHNMPFEVDSIPNGVAVKFWRSDAHKAIVAPRGSISTRV